MAKLTLEQKRARRQARAFGSRAAYLSRLPMVNVAALSRAGLFFYELGTFGCAMAAASAAFRAHPELRGDDRD